MSNRNSVPGATGALALPGAWGTQNAPHALVALTAPPAWSAGSGWRDISCTPQPNPRRPDAEYAADQAPPVRRDQRGAEWCEQYG